MVDRDTRVVGLTLNSDACLSCTHPVGGYWCNDDTGGGLPCGYKWVSGYVSPVWPTVILCLGPAGSSRSSLKQVHACDGVGRASTTHVTGVERP